MGVCVCVLAYQEYTVHRMARLLRNDAFAMYRARFPNLQPFASLFLSRFYFFLCFLGYAVASYPTNRADGGFAQIVCVCVFFFLLLLFVCDFPHFPKANQKRNKQTTNVTTHTHSCRWEGEKGGEWNELAKRVPNGDFAFNWAHKLLHHLVFGIYKRFLLIWLFFFFLLNTKSGTLSVRQLPNFICLGVCVCCVL